MRALRNTAYVCAFFAYVLIVFGAFVRITGSGLGCGDQWPLCNGRIIPPLDDVAVIIEYGHRLTAVGLSVLVVVLIGLAIAQRRQPGGSGAGGTFAPAMVATALLVVQILLGAVTVWLDLAAAAVVLHLATAMALLAALLITGLRAGTRAEHPAQSAGASTRRSAHVAAGLGAAAILLGGLTATSGAGPLCLGFPLCNGQVWPSGPGLVHIHWTHRLVAYALFFHALGLAMAARRKAAPPRILAAAWAAFGIVVLQIAVAAAMILSLFPPALRGLHAAVGTALWAALVYLVWQVRREVNPLPIESAAPARSGS